MKCYHNSMKILLISILALFLSGCIYLNDRGISSKYYNGCKEYYDSMGMYHKECDKNIVDYKDIKKACSRTKEESDY